MRAGLGGRFEAPCPFGGIKIMSIFAVVPSGHIHLNETARTLVLGHLKVAVSAIGRTVLGVVIGFFVTLHSAETGKSRSGRGSHLYLGFSLACGFPAWGRTVTNQKFRKGCPLHLLDSLDFLACLAAIPRPIHVEGFKRF